MKRSLLENDIPRKRQRVYSDSELENSDSSLSVTTPDLLSDEESRYASALIGDVVLSDKILHDTDLEPDRPVVELASVLESIDQAVGKACADNEMTKNQGLGFVVQGLERSVSELATVLTPMVQLPDLNETVLENHVELDLPEIERSVIELAAVLAPMAKMAQTKEKLIDNKVELDAPQIERSVTELAAVLSPFAKDPKADRMKKKDKVRLNVPELERSVSELTSALAKFDTDIVLETKTRDEVFSDQAQEKKLHAHFPDEDEALKYLLKSKEVGIYEHEVEELELPKPDLEDQTEPTQKLTGVPSHAKVVSSADSVNIIPVVNSFYSMEATETLSHPHQMPSKDIKQRIFQPGPFTCSNFEISDELLSLPLLIANAAKDTCLTSTKSATKDVHNAKALNVDEKQSTIVSSPQDSTSEKLGFEAFHLPLTQRRHTDSTSSAKRSAANLRAVKEDLVRAYKAVAKADGGGLSDARLGSLLLWLGVPRLSVDRHVRRILRHKGRTGKALRSTSLKNILKYINYVLA